MLYVSRLFPLLLLFFRRVVVSGSLTGGIHIHQTRGATVIRCSRRRRRLELVREKRNWVGAGPASVSPYYCYYYYIIIFANNGHNSFLLSPSWEVGFVCGVYSGAAGFVLSECWAKCEKFTNDCSNFT